jgi:hypothetical protein
VSQNCTVTVHLCFNISISVFMLDIYALNSTSTLVNIKEIVMLEQPFGSSSK